MSFKSKEVLNQILNDSKLVDSIKSQNLLLVGCGGIGCEVIKNLLLIGFNNIKMIDLDTIDVSNLNRQFLFNKSHINQSKSIISAKIATDLFAYGQEVNIQPIHNSIQSQEYDVDFFKSFSLVINALDNRQARSHVNRMCLAADVPLIESGTEGYIGQTFVIKKNISMCYECEGPKQDQKTYASCTIRNTPSLPIHCIIWGKHLFTQLFGESDSNNDVSPNMKEVFSTKKWAQDNNYNPIILFEKFFKLDIEYLHQMEDLWKNRNKPITLKYEELNKDLPTSSSNSDFSDKNLNQNILLKDQRLLTLKECYELFELSIFQLKQRLSSETYLLWDKDDESSLDFVCAVSNLRSYCFHIERKSKFDIKSMAGNIIPAISSTNSIIGGLMVLQILNLLRQTSKLKEEEKDCKKQIDLVYKSTIKHIFLRKVNINIGNLISAYTCFEPNQNCLVCCTKNIPELEVSLNLQKTTMYEFIEKFLLNKLNFICPDIQLDGQPTIIWSKEIIEDANEEEIKIYKTKTLNKYSCIKDKVRLKVIDLIQTLTVIINLKNENFNLNENFGLFYKMNVLTMNNEDTIEEIEDLNKKNIKNNKNEIEKLIEEENNEDNKFKNNNLNINIEEIDFSNGNRKQYDLNHFEKNKNIEIINLESEEKKLTNLTMNDDDSCEIICDNIEDINVINLKDKRKYLEIDEIEDENYTQFKKFKV